MTVAYNQMLRRAHGRLAIRDVDIPARTLGIDVWERQEPIAPLRRPRVPDPNPPAAVIAAMSPAFAPDYGAPGRGPGTPNPKNITGAPWYGPGVADL